MNKENLKKIYDELKDKGASDSETTEVIRKIHFKDNIEMDDRGAESLVQTAKTELNLEEKTNINEYELVVSRMYAILLVLNFVIEDNNKRLVEIINENNKERSN